jgi:hypothetical protein
MLLLVLVPPAYVVSRSSGIFTGDYLLTTGRDLGIEERRVRSLGGRLYHEGRLVTKAVQRPYFGWGGYGRNRIYNEEGEDTSVTDGMWIVTFGVKGTIALSASGLFLLLPLFFLWKRNGRKTLLRPEVAPAAALALVVTLFAIDCLLNYFLNPYYILCAGSLIALPGWEQAKKNKDAARRAGRMDEKERRRPSARQGSSEVILHRGQQERQPEPRQRPVY